MINCLLLISLLNFFPASPLLCENIPGMTATGFGHAPFGLEWGQSLAKVKNIMLRNDPELQIVKIPADGEQFDSIVGTIAGIDTSYIFICRIGPNGLDRLTLLSDSDAVPGTQGGAIAAKFNAALAKSPEYKRISSPLNKKYAFEELYESERSYALITCDGADKDCAIAMAVWMPKKALAPKDGDPAPVKPDDKSWGSEIDGIEEMIEELRK